MVSKFSIIPLGIEAVGELGLNRLVRASDSFLEGLRELAKPHCAAEWERGAIVKKLKSQTMQWLPQLEVFGVPHIGPASPAMHYSAAVFGARPDWLNVAEYRTPTIVSGLESLGLIKQIAESRGRQIVANPHGLEGAEIAKLIGTGKGKGQIVFEKNIFPTAIFRETPQSLITPCDPSYTLSYSGDVHVSIARAGRSPLLTSQKSGMSIFFDTNRSNISVRVSQITRQEDGTLRLTHPEGMLKTNSGARVVQTKLEKDYTVGSLFTKDGVILDWDVPRPEAQSFSAWSGI